MPEYRVFSEVGMKEVVEDVVLRDVLHGLVEETVGAVPGLAALAVSDAGRAGLPMAPRFPDALAVVDSHTEGEPQGPLIR